MVLVFSGCRSGIGAAVSSAECICSSSRCAMGASSKAYINKGQEPLVEGRVKDQNNGSIQEGIMQTFDAIISFCSTIIH